MLNYLLLGMLMMGNHSQHSKRTLLLFADKNSQRSLRQQQMFLRNDKAGMTQRDLEVKVYNTQNKAAYNSNHVRGGFTVILIGKDGGEKLRSHKPVTTQKLFALIDEMPMRKAEITHAGGYEE